MTERSCAWLKLNEDGRHYHMEPSGNRQLRARFPISGCAIRPTPVSSRCLSTGAKQGGGATTASQLYCNARLATGSALLQCASGVHSFHLLLARSAKAARHACFASGIHEDARPGCVCHPQLTATGSLTLSWTLATYHPQVATVASPRPRPTPRQPQPGAPVQRA